MTETSGFGIILLLFGLLCVALYLLPVFVAFSRDHEYRWVIFALTIFGGWTGVCWLIAMIWAVFPHNRPVIDPILGPATGVGYRNAGDALGAVQYGQERGYHEEQKKRVEPWSQPLPAPRASVPSTGKLATSADTIESLERLQRLREAGALSAEEFEAEKRRVLGG